MRFVEEQINVNKRNIFLFDLDYLKRQKKKNHDWYCCTFSCFNYSKTGSFAKKKEKKNN